MSILLAVATVAASSTAAYLAGLRHGLHRLALQYTAEHPITKSENPFRRGGQS